MLFKDKIKETNLQPVVSKSQISNAQQSESIDNETITIKFTETKS